MTYGISMMFHTWKMVSLNSMTEDTLQTSPMITQQLYQHSECAFEVYMYPRKPKF